MKKLTKKFKDVKVEITFAESKEYDTVKETLMEDLHECIKTGKISFKKVSKPYKRQRPDKKGNPRRKEVISSKKKQMPRLSEK